jgi:hypothetical protein
MPAMPYIDPKSASGFCGGVALLLLEQRNILSVRNRAIWGLASVIVSLPPILIRGLLRRLEPENFMAMKCVMLKLDGGKLLRCSSPSSCSTPTWPSPSAS